MPLRTRMASAHCTRGTIAVSRPERKRDAARAYSSKIGLLLGTRLRYVSMYLCSCTYFTRTSCTRCIIHWGTSLRVCDSSIILDPIMHLAAVTKVIWTRLSDVGDGGDEGWLSHSFLCDHCDFKRKEMETKTIIGWVRCHESMRAKE